MTLRSQITADLDLLFTDANLADTLIYAPDVGAPVTLLGSWAIGDEHAAVESLANKHIGLAVFTFPISQLAAFELDQARFIHADYDKAWVLHKPPFKPDAFTWRLVLTQPQKHKLGRIG